MAPQCCQDGRTLSETDKRKGLGASPPVSSSITSGLKPPPERVSRTLCTTSTLESTPFRGGLSYMCSVDNKPHASEAQAVPVPGKSDGCKEDRPRPIALVNHA